MSEAPPFWFRKPGAVSWLLAPLGIVYGKVSSKRMVSPPSSISRVPVICIGNFVAGGAGKTPTAIAMARIARAAGLRPGFLTRGYGGRISKPTLVDIKTHNALDVGDEPLILGLYGATVVSSDRPAGAALLEEQEVDLIFMDDGFQNPSLHKDYSLVVVDARRGIGNGFCIPAGPLRAPLKTQMAAASAILLIGRSDETGTVVRRAAKLAKPIFQADIVPRKPQEVENKDVLAFAGIADPDKFYNSLEAAGATIVERKSFADHHSFSSGECQELLKTARLKQLTIVTTEKDHVRLIRAGSAQQELRAASRVFGIDLQFENPKIIEHLLREVIENAVSYRLKIKNN